MIDWIVSLLLLLGTLFVLVAGIGILRLPDTLSRAHALSKALTLGVSLALLSLMLTIGTFLALSKVLLAIFIQIVTIPVAGHIFALYAKKS